MAKVIVAAADPVRHSTGAMSRLGIKLTVALLSFSGLMLLFLVAFLGPQTQRSFATRCDEIVVQTTGMMRRLAAEHTEASRRVIVDLIDHTADARSRTLVDLPLALYGGDEQRIRAAILAVDAERAGRMQRNVGVLAREMQRRASTRIDAHLSAIADEQVARIDGFAADLNQSHLLLSGAALGVLILVLGIGLYRMVVRPVGALRATTRRVALGELDVWVPVRSADEIGALAADFAVMLGQLRASRDELTRLNRDLESEVERKTEHLQGALADLKKAQRQLVQAEKMASMGTLAGGIAHEFNNLIGGIRGCASEAMAEASSAAIRETLAVILRAADRATAITQQLMRFARPSVDRTARVDVAAVLSDALRLVEPEARRRGVVIERTGCDDITVSGDADGLHQVFVNLFTNALQAMPAGGSLTIATEDLDAEVLVRVTDTGVGIAPEDLDHVFEPFFTRKDGERDPAQRGTGLGLSVSYGIVDAHGGAFAVESRLGAGSTFTVRLPRGDACRKASR